MKPGDIVVCWNENGLKRVRRLESRLYLSGDIVSWYICGPVAPGYEGQAGCHYDHAELFEVRP